MDNKIITACQLIKSNVVMTITGDDIDSIVWGDGETPISKEDIEAKIPEAEQFIADKKQAKIDNKASAKAKLIAGEALTEDEANTIVL
tara:strand:- start:115 stop:378 length:264 start_codon:yes stop_codon:yes gene_type:complete